MVRNSILVFASSCSDCKSDTSYIDSLAIIRKPPSHIANWSDLADILSVILLAKALTYLKT